MKEQRRTAAAVVALLVVGAGCMVARTMATNKASIARDEKLWRLTYRLTLESDKPKAKLKAVLPVTYRACRVVRESFSSSGLVMDIVRDKTTGQRQAVAVLRKSGEPGVLEAQFDILVSPKASAPSRATALSAESRALYLHQEVKTTAKLAAMAKLIAGWSKGETSHSDLSNHIFEECKLPEELGLHDDESDAVILAKTRAAVLGRAKRMVALCRAAKIPARLVAGFMLQLEKDTKPHVWVEVYDGAWWPYDPEYGYARELPQNYLCVRRDGALVAEGSSGATLQKIFRVHAVEETVGISSGQATGLLAILDLTRLPLGMQQTLAMLLLLPVGALITAFWRNIIGFQTFGTFTPSLLAMTFLYSDWHSGLVIFVVVMAIGLGGRACLNRMKLLMVPRLGAILTLVVLCLAVAVSALDHFGLAPSARAVILPLVILTMLIERFYIRSEEDGIVSSTRLLIMTFVLAGLCLLLLRWETLGRLVVRYPEMGLFVLAGMLVIGRYSGYRITELFRFRDLVKTDSGEGKSDG